MDIKSYLARIGLKSAPEPTLAGLQLLQDHHMRAVPFENIDVLLGRPLNLSLQALFEKIITRERGGYCFELNTLYAALLTEIGFAPVPMMARVWLRAPVATPPRTHLVNRVKINDQDWISDVGFGGRAARVPLKIEDGFEVDDGDGRIRLIKDDVFGFRIQRKQDGLWLDQYTVETARAHQSDILSGNHWTENHQDSHFRHGLGVGIFTPNGRTSFYDGVLTERGTDTQTRAVSGVSSVLSLLNQHFGLSLALSPKDKNRLSAFVTP